jgi:hypothetical protein
VPVRSLLLRAFRARAHPPRVRVVVNTRDAALENRYRLLFPGVRFEDGGAEGFVERLAPPLQ